GFGISSRCKYPEQAWDMIIRLCGTDNAYTRFATIGGTPANRSLLENKGYFVDENRNNILQELHYAVKDYYPVDPIGNPFKFMEQIVNPEIKKILFNGDDVRITLDKLAQKLDQSLEQRWKEVN